MNDKNDQISEQKSNKQSKVIVDCNYTLTDALKGITIPPAIKKEQTIVPVEYYSFDNKLHKGQLVINRHLKKDIIEIFKVIKKTKFPVAKVIPIVAYNWSDSASMEDNNTSAFNYRVIKGTTKLSNHALGKAIDINPLFNPQIKKDEVLPSNGSYIPNRAGTITKNSTIVQAFKKRGWTWGGDWRSSKDYQHFEKVK